MAAAHAGVQEGGIHKGKLFARGVLVVLHRPQLRFNLRRLLRFVDIILPLRAQNVDLGLLLLGPIVIFQIVDDHAAQAVLYHIADNPVRGKELGDGGDLLLGDFAVLGKGLVFWLRIVILIQPADDLHLAAFINIEIALRDRIHEHPDHTVTGVRQF